MRQRAVLIALAVLIVVAIVASVVFLQGQKPGGGDSAATSSGAATAVATSQATDASTATATSPATAPSPGAQVANPSPEGGNPAAKVDLTTDASGLSKTTAVIETAHGKIKFKFYPKSAPNTVNRIIELINQGFYNGLTFHRVVEGFVIQGGDPKGDGTGGSGQKLKAEFNELQHIPGTVAMARAQDPDSADSQFYIALDRLPHLDRSYTIFGQVTEGMDVVKKVQPNDKMLKVYLE